MPESTEVPTLSTEMKFYNFIFCTLFIISVYILASSDGVKESASHGSVNDNESLIIELIKRLGKPSYNYQSDDQEGELSRPDSDLPSKQSESASNELQNLQAVCDHTIEKGSIIKSTESIAAGALYIDSVKYVKSNAECLEYCCQNSTCDVAVYQDKGERYCYLFRCAGQCIFKPHTGYLVSTIKGRKSSEHPEEDLQNLNDEITGSNGGDKKKAQDTVQKLAENQKIVSPVAELTTFKMVATTETETPELVIAPHSVGLGGFCTQNGQCEDPNAVCRHGNCVCKDSFYSKDGMCRKVCLQSEFECYELGTLERGPECISRSQVCDSYLNCADGSDEFSCAPNYQQTNRSQQPEPSSVSNKGAAKNSNLADSYTQPVVQEPAADSHHNKIDPQPFQSHVAKVHGTSYQVKADNLQPSRQNYDVRLKPTISSKDGALHSNQNLYSGNVQPIASQPNSYPNTGYVNNPPVNSDRSSAYAANTNQARKGVVNHEPLSHPTVPKSSNSASMQQTNAAVLNNKANSDNLVQLSDPTQTGQHQRLEQNDNGQILQKHIQKNLQPAVQTDYADARQSSQYSSQSIDSHDVKSHQNAEAPQTSVQENGVRPSSNLHSEASVNSFPQNNWHSDKSLQQKTSSFSSLKSSKPTNLHSHISENASSKSRTNIQTSSKSHASPFDQSESQNHLSLPNYSNSQKWLDPNLYVPYNLRESQSQQEQAPVGNNYFDSSQYYPPYSSDSLDPIPESLLENTGSNDEFSQFGGPSIGHGKSMSLPYNTQNSGYQGYAESSYGGQYPPIRYDDSGDYRSPVYQDPDMYSLGNQRAYRPSVGLYEDFPTAMRPPAKLNTIRKVQDSELPSTEQKNIKDPVIVHEQNTQGIITNARTELHSTRLPLDAVSSKNKTSSSTTSPLPATFKPFPESHGEKKHIFLSSEKFIIANTSDAEGPIIALSLGLAFTIILLVLVGCRLRNVRHRLRKGRPLHQNEADYLINGMYL